MERKLHQKEALLRKGCKRGRKCSQKGAKERQKEPEGSQKEPTGAKRSKKGAKMEPMEAKREPNINSDQKASKSRLGRQGRCLRPKREQPASSRGSFWEPFLPKSPSKIDATIVAKKNVNFHEKKKGLKIDAKRYEN